jgi:PAS domain S-box-containing protein
MGYKVNPPSTKELRQMAVQRIGAPIAQDAVGLTGAHAKQLLEEVAISKIEVEIQNVYLQDTCARLDVALNEITDLYDFAPVGFVSTDAAGRISKLNLVGAHLLGSERNTLMGGIFADFFSPDQRDRVRALMRLASDSGEDQHGDVQMGGTNRPLQHVQLSLTPLYAVQGHHIVLINITDRRALEDDLRASEQCWKQALESTGEGLWDWDLRADTLHFSPRLAQWYGVPAEQLGSILDGWRERVHPDDWPALLGHIQDCLKGGEAHFRSEHRGLCKRGGWIWIACRGVVLGRDDGARALRLVGTDTDISERKRMQAELLEGGDIQRTLFESLPQYLAVLDAQGCVVRTNAVWNAYALASGHAYRNGYIHTPYADLLDAVAGGAGPIQREALAGIGDVIAGKVPTFQLEYSFGCGTDKRWFIMLAMAVHGTHARAVVSHQDVTRLRGQMVAPAAY